MKTVTITEENRFSTFVKSRYSSEYRMLEKWQRWFADRSILATIAYTKSGYALYREGLVEVPMDAESSAH